MSTSSPPESRLTATEKVLAAVPAALALLLLVAYFGYFWAYLKAPAGGTDSWGQFGDFLGGLVNPVVGMVTIILLIRTLKEQQRAITLQSTELSEQRAELVLQRTEAAKSAAALDAQYKAIVRQSFEQTFFVWLESYRLAVAPVLGRDSGSPLSGRLWRGGMPQIGDVELFVAEVESADLQRAEYIREMRKSEIARWWQLTILEHMGSELGVCLRTLYSLIRWVDRNANLSGEERWDYVSIARARLSHEELLLLFFNGFHPDGQAFTKLVNRYSLLDNLIPNKHPFVLMAIKMDIAPFAIDAFRSPKTRAETPKS